MFSWISCIPPLAIILSELLRESYQQIICGLIFGFTYGVYVTTNILILRLLVDDLESALGLDLLSVSVASVIGPVSVGKNSIMKLETITWTFVRSCV